MSEFIAEAQVLIVPNTDAFVVSLKKQLEAAVLAAGPLVVPVAAAPLAAGGAAATAGIKAQRTELEVLGAEQSAAAVSADRLSRAQVAAAAASQKLALAEGEVHGAASLASAAQITFTRSTAAVAAAENALVLALREGDAERIAAVQNTLRLAKAQAVSAETALADARAQATRAAALSQANRAVLAQAASTAGLRGAVLSSTAAFLGATVAAVAIKKTVEAASDLNEEINKTDEVFGKSADTIESWSKTTAQSLGIARTEALRSAANFGELFRTLGVTTPKAAELSKTLVTLSADLASFFNASPEQTLQAIQSGLVGQARPLRQFGVFLTEARVKQEALIQTGKKNISSLTQQDKILARYNLILADSGIATGDFARTQENLANQGRILKANIEDLGGQLGAVLLPVVLFTVQGLNDLADEARIVGATVGTLSHQIGDLASDVARLSPVQFVIQIIEEVPGGGTASSFFKNFKANLEIGIGAAAIAVGAATSELGIGLAIAAGGTVVLAKGLKDLNAEVAKSKEVTTQVAELFKQFKQAGGGAAALQTLLSKLQALEAELSNGDAASQALARGLLRTIIKLRALGDDASVAEIGKAIADGIAKGFANRAFVIGDAVKAAITFSQSQITGQLQAQVTAVARAQAFGGTGLAELQTELARIDKILASEKAPIGPVLEALLNERKSVVAQIKSINEDASKRVIAAATKAAQDQNEAIQNFIDTFSGKHQNLENRLSSASLFGTAKQQIAINKLIVAADAAEIKAIQAAIRHLHLHGDALKAAQAEIARLNQEIFNTRNAIIKLQSERKQTLADARQSHLEAQLAIAETTASNRDDAAAQKALIKFDQAQIRRILAIKRRRRLTQDEAAQLDAYRVDLAQRNAALKGLKEEADDTGKKMKELLFSFLQTQQGFAANLLGNLIPGFATGGLVGGSAGAAASSGGGTGAFPGALSPEEHGRGAAALAGGRERGVRPIQVDTTNQILRAILRSLQNLNGRAGHPEARYQKSAASGSFDTLVS